jgi:hypothetical protein
MNYIAAASERNLDLAQLPKMVQKKIQELESLVIEYEKIFQDIPRENLNEKQLESVTLIEEKISEIDAFLTKKVKSFDPVKYQAKVDNFNRMLEAKAKKKEQPQEKLQEPVQTSAPEPVKEITSVEPVHQPAPQPVQTQSMPQQEVEEQDEEDDDDDEFDKVANVKPKSNLLTYGLIALGVGLLTLGAVRLKRK